MQTEKKESINKETNKGKEKRENEQKVKEGEEGKEEIILD